MGDGTLCRYTPAQIALITFSLVAALLALSLRPPSDCPFSVDRQFAPPAGRALALGISRQKHVRSSALRLLYALYEKSQNGTVDGGGSKAGRARERATSRARPAGNVDRGARKAVMRSAGDCDMADS